MVESFHDDDVNRLPLREAPQLINALNYELFNTGFIQSIPETHSSERLLDNRADDNLREQRSTAAR
ncbi:hypothetical protein SAMN04489806_1678 [Paramicrobacterium humi]|uniref:Uncharacterized protein n=1 Tax=Paramicrobacterium humi TaxID=640635 RepID=A0A1H4LWZ5_9MICO|nr:hypothetical protein SAMN04489806_1678 [Microbacterium humi]